jgi:hypothetical protein
LADTLEDRAVVVQLQRKAKTAKVARLRKRDCEEFAVLRQKAARWAEDNFSKLTDPEPKIPDVLNDRAADNWRPLLAIAELAGGEWPRRAREAACLLSGEGHEAPSKNVELLADIRRAFGDDNALRSVDLVAKLVADPERPWVEWQRGKPLSPKQLGSLLAPFRITSETVRIAGLADAKGYQRSRFEELWEVYLAGQSTSADPSPPILPSKRPNADEADTSHTFPIRPEGVADASKKGDLSYGDEGLDGWTAKKLSKGPQGRLTTTETKSGDTPPTRAQLTEPTTTSARVSSKTKSTLERAEVAAVKTDEFDEIPNFLRRCVQCSAPGDDRGPVTAYQLGGQLLWLHVECHRFLAQRPGSAQEAIDRVRQ